MENVVVPIAAFLSITVLAATGIHIAIAMAVVGVLLSIFYQGLTHTIDLAGISAWSNMAQFSIAMIPLFVLMGTLCGRTGIGKDAYACLHAWLHRIKGSLAMVTVGSCALFASLTGSSTATVAAIGGISLPEMTNRGYAKSLRYGVIAASGTLGVLIPPSIFLIFYGILTETSIGKLFMAGIIPGALSAILFCSVIYFWVARDPERIAPVEGAQHYSFKEKLILTAKLVPVVMVFSIVIASIYFGFASPGEAAAFGVFAVLCVTLVMRRLTWKSFKESLDDSLRITGFIAFIIIAALFFSSSIALTGFAQTLNDFVTNLNLPPFVIMLVIVAIYLVLGCVLDTFGLMVLTVPVFHPIVVSLGYDSVWYGVMVTILVECALITPPIGTNIYVTQSLEREAKSWDVIKGVTPFLLAQIAIIVLIIVFPQIVMWLPDKMY